MADLLYPSFFSWVGVPFLPQLVGKAIVVSSRKKSLITEPFLVTWVSRVTSCRHDYRMGGCFLAWLLNVKQLVNNIQIGYDSTSDELHWCASLNQRDVMLQSHTLDTCLFWSCGEQFWHVIWGFLSRMFCICTTCTWHLFYFRVCVLCASWDYSHGMFCSHNGYIVYLWCPRECSVHALANSVPLWMQNSTSCNWIFCSCHALPLCGGLVHSWCSWQNYIFHT